MKTNSRTFMVGVGLMTLGIVAFGLQSRSSYSQLRLLGAAEIRSESKGALPAKCTVQLLTYTCGDQFNRCASQPITACLITCFACTLSQQEESQCYTGKPWNSINCGDQIPDPTGCGIQFDPGQCQPGQMPVCVCSNGINNGMNCERKTAVGGTQCAIVH